MTQQGDANGNLWPCSKLLQHPPQVRGFRLKEQHQSEHSDQFNPFFNPENVKNKNIARLKLTSSEKLPKKNKRYFLFSSNILT